MKRIYSVAWSPNGHWVACSGNSNQIEIWDWRLKEVVQKLEGKKKGIRSLSWSPDSRLISSGQGYWKEHESDHVQTWKVANSEPLWTTEEAFHGCYTVCFDPFGEWLVTGHGLGVVNIWHARTGERFRTISVGEDIRNLINGLSFNREGTFLAFGTCYENELYIYDLNNTSAQSLVYPRHWTWVDFEHPVRYSPDNKWIARGTQRGPIRLWKAKHPFTLTELYGHELPTYAISWSPDSKYLATGSMAGRIKIWDVASKKEVHTITHRSLHSICYNPDGDMLASGGDDGSIRIWDVDLKSPKFGQPLMIFKHNEES